MSKAGNNLKFGIIKEGKVPVDERVPFVPEQCKQILDDFDCDLVVQSSDLRRIKDEAYIGEGISVVHEVDDCDVLFGVKEVPIDDLISNKTYLFFSHTIKEQPYNRKLLQTVLERNIRLIDYECLTDQKGGRILGFGRYAGIVGAYNGFRMIGEQTGDFSLKAAYTCKDQEELFHELRKIKSKPLKICITGRGRVAGGAIEILEALSIPKVDVQSYLNESFDESVYVQLAVTDYNKRKDGSEGSIPEFFKQPELYDSDFARFLPTTDFYIASHYWDSNAPFIFTKEQMKGGDFKIQYISDISCDIDGPIPSTIRPSTISEPFYSIDPLTGKEVLFKSPNSLAVMAVDNLPCELPVDASRDFGVQLMEKVVPSFFNGDSEEILSRATIAEKGALGKHFAYLQDYVSGKS